MPSAYIIFTDYLQDFSTAMKRIALFPGSFDPFTRGHEALVEQTLELFDEVVVAIGANMAKNSLLDVESRFRLISDLYADNPRVKVASYDNLTGEFARTVGATVLVRGIRNTTDFNYERSIEATNRRLFPELTTVLLVTPDEYAHISSSIVRELVSFGHDVTEFVPQGTRLDKYLQKDKNNE